MSKTQPKKEQGLYVLGNRVLIREDEPDIIKRAAAADIALTDETREQARQRSELFYAVIVAVGNSDKMPLFVKESGVPEKLCAGMRVLCTRIGGKDVPGMPGIRLVSAEDVLGVVA